MEVGTVETIEEKPGKRKPGSGLGNRRGAGSGDNKNRGGGGGNNGGGGGDRADNDYQEKIEYPSNRFRIAMWFLLLVVLMTFGGLIGAYIVISTNGVMEWKPFELPVQVWISTIFLIASSICYEFAKRALNNERQIEAKKGLLATTVLGGMFIASQLILWLSLYSQGVYLASNPYAGFFYILTAIHAIHVIGGIAALGYIVLRTWEPTSVEKELEDRQMFANVIGWYWHFMDGLWLVLIGLLAFWK